MRVRITQRLTGSIDGIQLDQFEPGYIYDVGTSMGSYLMAIHAAEPIVDETPALVVPLNQQSIVAPPRIRLDTREKLGTLERFGAVRAADWPGRRDDRE